MNLLFLGYFWMFKVISISEEMAKIKAFAVLGFIILATVLNIESLIFIYIYPLELFNSKPVIIGLSLFIYIFTYYIIFIKKSNESILFEKATKYRRIQRYSQSFLSLTILAINVWLFFELGGIIRNMKGFN